MRWPLVLCSAFLLIASVARAQDHQVWDEIDVTGVWHDIAFIVPFVVRLDMRGPHLPLAATGVMADLVLLWHVTLTGGYLFADLNIASQRSVVQIPLVAASVSW